MGSVDILLTGQCHALNVIGSYHMQNALNVIGSCHTQNVIGQNQALNVIGQCHTLIIWDWLTIDLSGPLQ